jgi:hypothetical protein
VDEDYVAIFEDEEDDDCGLLIAPSLRSGPSSNRGTLRGSFSNESKTTTPLPSIALKYWTDIPEPQELDYSETVPGAGQRERSPSPPQSTLE